MVHARRRPWRRDPVLSRASAPRASGARADARGRRGRSRLVPQDSASRGRPRNRQRVPAAATPDEAAAVRQPRDRVSGVLHAEAVQQKLRPPSRSLVRAKPSGRGLRRNVRRVARSRVDVGDALRRVAGTAQARIHGSPDAAAFTRAAEGQVEARGRSAPAAEEDASRALSQEARALRPRSPRLLRQRSAQSVLRLARVREEPAGRAVRAQDPQGRARPRGELHRQLSIHDRSAARKSDRALPRAQPAADGFRRGNEDGLHGLPHSADDELSAQRAAPGGAVTKLRVLALVHRHLIPPATVDEGTDVTSAPWRTEYDVISTLTAMGHEVRPLGVHDDLGEIRRLADEWKPHIAFNLLEGFDDVTIFDQNVVSHLELLKLPYTGCNPRGLLMARDKSLSKKLLAYHRIAVPEFEVCRIGRPIRRHKRLTFPLIVKSLTQEASIGISQASVVDTDEKLNERVTFIHESIGTAAIVEQYIEGRELYVGVIGNQVLQALPVWELFFTNMPEGSKRIATDRVKWNAKYQKKYGIDSGPTKELTPERCEQIQYLCKRAYRALELSGYARIDLRLDACGNAWVIEANPNPQIAKGEDFAASAEKVGIAYEGVLQRITNLGLRWQPESVA